MRLREALRAWDSDKFAARLKQELESIGASQLPLQQGLSGASYALEDALSVMFLSAKEQDGFIQAKVGVFYKGLIAGCSCADDPTPVEPQDAYCEVLIRIDCHSAEATATLLDA
jgi:hypothetical protein